MFNKDYEVYREEVGEHNRWLFLNRQGKGFMDPTGYIDLENYVRINPEDKKKGQVLWKLKYNEAPHFDMGATLDDSESDGEGHAEVDDLLTMFGRMLNAGDERFYQMKFRTFSEAKLRSVKNPGGDFLVKIKAKGFVTRQVKITWTKDEEGNTQRNVSINDNEYVTKISYKIKNAADGATIDRFDLYHKSDSEMRWDCGAFKARLEAGWLGSKPHEIKTKPGVDPGFGLLFAHVCMTEFAPREIKKDLKPDWNLCPGYINPYAF